MRAASHVPSASTSRHVRGDGLAKERELRFVRHAAVSTVRHDGGTVANVPRQTRSPLDVFGRPGRRRDVGYRRSPLSRASRTPKALFPERTGPVMKTTAIAARHSTSSGLPPRCAEASLRRMLLNIVSIALGIAIIALTLSDVFQSVVVPRADGTALSHQLLRLARDVVPLAEARVAASTPPTATGAKISWRSSRRSCWCR